MPLRNVVFTFIACGLFGPVYANSADDFFADGNRLFNDKLYWAALLRYREAREAGLDTPTLAYNMAVAHYKAGQHARAREEFERALASPRLRQLARYNLGLNAAKLDQTAEALRWFRLSRDEGQNPRLSELSDEAIRRIRKQIRLDDPVEQRAERRRKVKEQIFTKLDVSLSAGFGNSNNIYRSPAAPYTDFAQAGDPLVSPEVVSGAFLPVDMSLRYNLKNQVFENFFARYRVAAKIFQDKELDNANEFIHQISFGSRYSREKNGVKRRVFSVFKISQHNETYFDPDDGLTRNINGIEIGDRLNHRRYGPAIYFRQDGPRLGVGGFFEGQLRNYEDVEAVPEYDHELLRLGAHVQFKFTPSSLLRFELDGTSRSFGDRPAYDLDGRQRLGNPNVDYQYVSAALIARQRPSRHSWFGFEIQRTERSDGYVGYYDYTRDSFSAEAEWFPSSRFRIKASARYSIYDYPNAFAFNDQNLNRRTLETLRGRFEASWKISEHFHLIGEAISRESSSNDARIQYDQTEVSLSVRWEY